MEIGTTLKRERSIQVNIATEIVAYLPGTHGWSETKIEILAGTFKKGEFFSRHFAFFQQFHWWI